MIKDDIIKLAHEAGFMPTVLNHWPAELERFAKLVAAAEREACAKVCEMGQHSEYDGHADCAAAIRARTTRHDQR